MNRREFLSCTATGAGVLTMGTRRVAGALSDRRRREAKPAGGLVAFRISHEQWARETRFEELLAFFRRHRGVADEIVFFTSSTHPPLPLGEIRQRAAILTRRLERVRAEGLSAGINLLATMGHHEENLEGSLAEPWPRVTDIQGAVSRGSFCPGSEALRAYVVEVYEALAEARPDFIWIDDDVRLAGHMPVGMTCFCDGCLGRFARETGREWTRPALARAFASGSWAERVALRRSWLEHNRKLIGDLFALIESTVHRRRSDLELGFMTGDRFFEGYDFSRWAETLSGPGRVPVRWRPGGGFYSDETLSGLVGKAHDIGRQVAELPTEVRVIQSEIENFPYDLLRKAAETTALEAAVHMAAGCTGAAFNVLSQRPDPLDEYDRMLSRIGRMKPFYGLLREQLGRTPLVGVWPAWNRDVFVANSADGAWPAGAADATGALTRAYVLGEIGLPLTYSAAGARVTVLAGPGLLSFSRAELERHFSGGVLLDTAAWQALDRLGVAEWTGVKLGEPRVRDAIEVLGDHPLNGRYAGYSRDCRQSFWHEPAVALEPMADGVEVLARMIDYRERDLGVSMSLYSNRLGGRVAVMGYFPWSQMHHLAKSSQMKSVCAWLSGASLPVWVESFHRAHLWLHATGSGSWACGVLNASLDPAEGLTLRVPVGTRNAVWHDPAKGVRAVRLRVSERGGAASGGASLRLPDRPAWSVGLVRFEV